jgi:hypothetical protein
MKSLYEQNTLAEIVNRLNNLQPDSPRQWGKMEPAQMMAHCTVLLEVATAQRFPPRVFIGRIIGPFLKSVLSSEEPLRKNTPTGKSYIVADHRDFEQEKERLINLMQQFQQGGEAKCTTHPHSFFGKLTPKEWGTGMYKHLDHHLRQFGV